jgi:GNAT superfamily N-acetyltransferase
MDVRKAGEHDIEGIAVARLSNGAAHDDSGASADYCRHLIANEHLWVAVEGERVLGFGGAVDVGRARLLSDLFVHSDSHGRGVGRALLTEVLRGAEHRFTFATHDPAALPLYMRAGMVPYHMVLALEGPATALSGADRGLRVREVAPEEAARWELDATGVDRANTYRYWADRDRSITVAVGEGEPVAVAAVRTGPDWARIEHLAMPPSGSLMVDVELACVAAIALHLSRRAVQVSVHGNGRLARQLVESGYAVVDTSVFMATGNDLLSDAVIVLHSGFG